MKEKKRKILHLAFDDYYGAGKSAYNLNNYINKMNYYDSKLLVYKKLTRNESVFEVSIKEKIIQKIYEKIFKFITFNKKELISFCLFKNSFKKYIAMFQPDIIHIHWIGKEMFSLKEIINSNKKIVWTQRDLWPILGLLHYRNSSNLKSKNFFFKFFDQLITYNKKKLNYDNIDVVSISNWQKKIIENSKLYKLKKISLIHNSVDLNIYKKLEKLNFKKNNNFYITFLAHNYLKDERKGYNLFKKIKKNFNFKKYFDLKFKFIIVGDFNNENNENENCIFLPNLENENDLSIIYNLSDIYLNTSRYETFGKTTSEAMSCDTPVIAYKETGAIDIIDHKINGYLVGNYDEDSFLKGLYWLIESIKNNKKLLCREKIINNFDINVIYEDYKQIYNR